MRKFDSKCIKQSLLKISERELLGSGLGNNTVGVEREAVKVVGRWRDSK